MIDERLIIDQPSLQSKRRRRISQGFTLLFWTAWFALWLPVLTLIAEALGIDLKIEPPVQLPDLTQFLSLVTWHVLVVATIPAILGLWIVYNVSLFKKTQERRTGETVTETEAVADHFGVAPEDLTRWQHARRLVIHLDEEGAVTRVETGEA